MKLHLFTSGKILTWKHLLVRNVPEGIRFTVPIPFYLLEHPKGLFLFDTGQQVTANTSAVDENFIPQITDELRAKNLLAEAGIFPADISGIILSHHHADHSSGIADFPGTLCYIRQEELQYPVWADRYDKANWIFPQGEYDLLGDGKIILLPTPGHTAGHQSLLLTLSGGRKVLLAADAAYTRQALTALPPQAEADQPYWQTIRHLQKYAADGVQIITGHDPEQWAELQNNFI